MIYKLTMRQAAYLDKTIQKKKKKKGQCLIIFSAANYRTDSSLTDNSSDSGWRFEGYTVQFDHEVLLSFPLVRVQVPRATDVSLPQ